MPYEFHTDLRTPPNNTILWRYMDFAKFVQLIGSGSLWFTRLDHLEDPLEGAHTDAELAGIRKNVEKTRARQLISLFRAARRELFVNCWGSATTESLAMWDLYGKGSGIVAVKSSLGRLKEAVAIYKESVFISKLRYIDWNDAPGLDNVLVACSRKDLSYEHESEIRAIILDVRSRTNQRSGIPVPIDIKGLITEVVVGPREQEWVMKLVVQVLKTYKVAWPVHASDRLKPRR